MTEAHTAFKANIKRARAFLSIFDNPGGAPRTQGQPSNNEKELLRATVVFAVAALDAYLHDIIIETVTTEGYHGDGLTDGLKYIAKEDPTLALRVALADDKAQRLHALREALGTWLASKSFQGPEAVAQSFRYLGKSNGRDSLNATLPPNWANQLEEFTKMRHQLVHRAGKVYVKRNEAGQCVDLIDAIETTVERISLQKGR